MSNYNLNKHVKRDKVKWIFTAVALLLVVVMLVGVCLEVFGTGKMKPSEFFKKEETPVAAEGGGMYIPEEVEENGIMLTSMSIPIAAYAQYDIMPDVESAQTITATLTPSDRHVMDSVFKWESAWKNPASAWATGKDVNDYLRLTPQPSSSAEYEATVECLQAFGEQIEIKFSTDDLFREKVSATATVDYMRRTEGVQLCIPVSGRLLERNFEDSHLVDFDKNGSIDEYLDIYFDLYDQGSDGGKCGYEWDWFDSRFNDPYTIDGEWKFRFSADDLHFFDGSFQAKVTEHGAYGTFSKAQGESSNESSFVPFDFKSFDITEEYWRFDIRSFYSDLKLCKYIDNRDYDNMNQGFHGYMTFGGTYDGEEFERACFDNDINHREILRINATFGNEELGLTSFFQSIKVRVKQVVDTSVISSIAFDEDRLFF